MCLIFVNIVFLQYNKHAKQKSILVLLAIVLLHECFLSFVTFRCLINTNLAHLGRRWVSFYYKISGTSLCLRHIPCLHTYTTISIPFLFER